MRIYRIVSFRIPLTEFDQQRSKAFLLKRWEGDDASQVVIIVRDFFLYRGRGEIEKKGENLSPTLTKRTNLEAHLGEVTKSVIELSSSVC